MVGLYLSLQGISLNFGGEPLFRDVGLEVAAGARIALVGRNGSGKSTLLKIAAGALEPDAGERFVKPGARFRYLPQEPDFGGFEKAEDYIASGLQPDQSRHRIDVLMDALKITPGTALCECSGGEARRIAIAAAFVAEPDVLLLDEPTNHLDLPTIAWLEDALKLMNAAIVVISHDRRFLEALTTRTVWIDRGETRDFDCGFRDFEPRRDKFLEEEEAALHKLGRKIVAEEHWLRYGVTARRKRNMRRLAALNELRAKQRNAQRPLGAVKFTKAETKLSGKRVIAADQISKSYDGKTVVKEFSIEIARGERIGIVGPNGAGKTTLLRMLIGDLEPDAGTVELGTNLDIVTIDQRRASLKPETRLADAIADERGDWVSVSGRKRHVASYLQDFLFAPEQWRAPVSSLSGGERGRLALAAALAKPSNLLALDEPTNDLDLETLDLLEDLLASYEGALLLISHDRSFLDRIATAILTTDPEDASQWLRYAGGYQDMIAQRGDAPAMRVRAPEKKKRNSVDAAPRATKQTKLSYKEEYALQTLPARIAELEAKIASLKTALEDPTLYERDAESFARNAAALAAAEAALAAAEDEWLALEVKREALASNN